MAVQVHMMLSLFACSLESWMSVTATSTCPMSWPTPPATTSTTTGRATRSAQGPHRTLPCPCHPPHTFPDNPDSPPPSTCIATLRHSTKRSHSVFSRERGRSPVGPGALNTPDCFEYPTLQITIGYPAYSSASGKFPVRCSEFPPCDGGSISPAVNPLPCDGESISLARHAGGRSGWR
eukprot:1195326-Prorocentrum_minimum.AAC.7